MINVPEANLSQKTIPYNEAAPRSAQKYKGWVLIAAVLLAGVSLQAQDNGRYDQVPNSAEDIKPLAVGDALPITVLFDADGKQFDIAGAIAAKPTILIFYRGGWCPFCNMHMGKLAKIEGELLDLGYQIFAITPDKPEMLKKSRAKWNAKYTLLSDSRMDAAIALGIAYKVAEATVKRYSRTKMNLDLNSGQDHHLLPVPAAYVIGRDGIIKFEYINPNYKVRINPKELLKVAKALVD